MDNDQLVLMPDVSAPSSLSVFQSAKADAFMQAFYDHVPRREVGDCNLAVVAARLAKDCLEAQHVRVRCLDVSVRALDRQQTERLCATGQMDGSWTVIAGADVDVAPGCYGHVVAVAWDRLVLDPTLPIGVTTVDGLELAGLSLEMPDAFFTGSACEYFLLGHCALEYRAWPHSDRYQRSPDWQQPARTGKARVAIRQQMRASLSQTPARARYAARTVWYVDGLLAPPLLDSCSDD